MSELERLHQQRMAREAEAKKQPPRRDPTEWRPRGHRDDRVQREVHAEHMRSQPLNHESLADFEPGVIAGMEANARAKLVAAMDYAGLTPDERGIRVHWQLVVEGYGWKMPEGFVHPEADDDLKAEGRTAWKRCVEMASDSFSKSMWVALWPVRKVLPSVPPKAIEGVGEPYDDEAIDRMLSGDTFAVTASSTEGSFCGLHDAGVLGAECTCEPVDAEIVEEG